MSCEASAVVFPCWNPNLFVLEATFLSPGDVWLTSGV